MIKNLYFDQVYDILNIFILSIYFFWINLFEENLIGINCSFKCEGSGEKG
jgi:hypothetical protein